jgi:hypothetical protein
LSGCRPNPSVPRRSIAHRELPEEFGRGRAAGSDWGCSAARERAERLSHATGNAATLIVAAPAVVPRKEDAPMDDDRITRARKRVHDLRGFYVHVAIYVVVISGIALINWVVSPGTWWVIWPMVGWGIGLGAHAVSVFFEGSLLGPEWEERKTRELLNHDRGAP